MKPYLIVYEVSPKADNQQAKNIGGAMATLIAFSTSKENAISSCENYISQYGWIAVEMQSASELHQQQSLEMDAQLQSVLRKAERSGISSHFDAWPKHPRGDVYSFESLKITPDK